MNGGPPNSLEGEEVNKNDLGRRSPWWGGGRKEPATTNFAGGRSCSTTSNLLCKSASLQHHLLCNFNFFWVRGGSVVPPFWLLWQGAGRVAGGVVDTTQRIHVQVIVVAGGGSQLDGGVLAPVDSSLIGGGFSTRRGSRTKEERESGREGVTPEGLMFLTHFGPAFIFSQCV